MNCTDTLHGLHRACQGLSSAIGSLRQSSKFHHGPANNVARSQQVEIFVKLVERDGFYCVADFSVSSKSHHFA